MIKLKNDTAGVIMFIDKYRPDSLSELHFNHEANKFLSSLAKHDNIPHLILEGNRGSGKRTRILLFLKERFGSGVMNIKNYKIQTELASRKEPLEMQVLISPYHYQMNPSIHGVHDKAVLQSFINDISKTKILTEQPYHIVVVEDADLLTYEAQESLRRTLETKISVCRFIFLVNREGKLIDPLYSRCVRIKLSAPTQSEAHQILNFICHEENLSLSPSILESIFQHAHYDLTMAIHYLNLVAIREPQCTEFVPERYDYVHKTILNMVNTLITGTDLMVIDKIREDLYKLMMHNIPYNLIIRKIIEILLPKISRTNPCIQFNICQIANHYDDSIRMASKPIYHIEAFCLKIFRELKILAAHKSQSKNKAHNSESGSNIGGNGSKGTSNKIKIKAQKRI